MKAITIHQMDDELYKLIQIGAEKRGWSMNKMMKELLGERMGVNKTRKKKIDLSKYLGVWSREECEEFDLVIVETEKIYPGDWL